MIHLKLIGSHYDLGKKQGAIFKEQNTSFPIKLNQWQLKRGIESLRLLEKFFPNAAIEIQGITEVIEYDYNIFGAWMMTMGCCLVMRENNNVEVRGCTAFCFTNKGKIYYGRNNDLPPYLKKVSKSIYYQPLLKNRFLLNTSSFINGEEGINEHGLVVAMTFVIPHREEIKPGFNSIFLVRYILENCASVQEGLHAIKSLPIASSCNILLADKTQEMILIECTPSEINIREAETNKNGERFLVTVNHFTSPEMQKYDKSNQNVYSSKLRYETAYTALSEANYKDPILFIENILKGKYGFMCQFKRIKFDTIWSTIIDINNSQVFLADGNPKDVRYKEIKH